MGAILIELALLAARVDFVEALVLHVVDAGLQDRRGRRLEAEGLPPAPISLFHTLFEENFDHVGGLLERYFGRGRMNERDEDSEGDDQKNERILHEILQTGCFANLGTIPLA